jgi:hypothetical protein
MSRCAIFTIVDYYNYGNRLLCAATCKIFSSLGVDAEIILVKDEKLNLSFSVKLKREIKRALRYCFDKTLVKMDLFFVKRIIKKIQKRIYAKTTRLRENRFIVFSKNHIAEKDYDLSAMYSPPSFPAKFDFFVVGGDQVWNPFFRYTYIPESVYFLPFVGNDQSAFMFSTSFGISKDAFFTKVTETPGLLDSYRNALSRMAFISCREEAGVEITRNLVGRGEVLIDPTMVLTQEEWFSIAKEPDFLNSRLKNRDGYVLLYFLGNLPRLLKKRIKKLCEDKNLALITLNDLTDKKAYITDPAEFVYLIAKARTVYTDSFHGVVFSILLETVFFVFERSGYKVNMLSRIDTLLRKFALEKRLIQDIKGFYPEDENLSMDYLKSREILLKEREKAIHYLKMAFNKAEKPSVESK